MKYIYSIIITIFVFSSCVTTNYLTIDIRQPAAVSFPPEVVNLVIVDNCASSPDNAESDTVREQYVITTDSARTIMLKSLQQFMTDENYFSKVELYPYKTNTSDTEDSMRPLSKRKAQAICNETGANGLISVDLYAVTATMESDKIGYFSNYNTLSTKVGSILKVYNEEGEELSRPVVYVDSLFRGVEANWVRLKTNLSEINDMVSEISVIAADKITATFIPSWKTETRWYYSDNSAEMKQAARYANEGKWQEAADIWGTLFDKADKPAKKARIASNLALANESLDDVPNAMNWINIAKDQFPEGKKSDLINQIAAYHVYLMLRINNIPKLNQQLGLEEVVEESQE